MDEIVLAAKLANAVEFIIRLPGGYDSQIGDRGATLSRGQRHAIGIAQALIGDNPIVILDQPTHRGAGRRIRGGRGDGTTDGRAAPSSPSPTA